MRDNWRRACADFEIDQGVTDMDTNISELEAPKPAKKPVVQPCYQCNSTAHRVKECPIATSMVKNILKKEMIPISLLGRVILQFTFMMTRDFFFVCLIKSSLTR